MTDCDVVIVGAGPTGLSLAAQCLGYGLSFVIIDRKDAPHRAVQSAGRARPHDRDL